MVFLAFRHQVLVLLCPACAHDLQPCRLHRGTLRSLSLDGVEYDMPVHPMAPGQIRSYNAYAEAFAVIRTTLDIAMKAANITGDSGTMNRQSAKSVAKLGRRVQTA